MVSNPLLFFYKLCYSAQDSFSALLSVTQGVSELLLIFNGEISRVRWNSLALKGSEMLNKQTWRCHGGTKR